jgi:uncharacterized repeat protein (TIGR02543 family)
VTLTGTNLTGATSVTIGGTAATEVTVVNATTITCTAPAGAAGTASVVVSTPGGSNAANTLYTYLAAPVVTSRTGGLAANAATVTIAGISFDPVAANNTVVFNNSAVGTVTGATATQLTVTFSIKPASAGVLTAIVTNEGGSSGTATPVATVIPVITSSTANLAIGATSLTINGFGFSPTPGNNTVVFTPAGSGTVTAATTTSLTVTGLGTLSAGALNGVVTTNGQSSGAAMAVATVVAAPTVTGVSPVRGPTTGATRVTLTGTNLTGATSVTIGGTAATEVTVLNATSITCTTPAGVAGTASVVVNTPGGVNAANTLYTYLAAPAVTSRTVNLAANAATLTIAGTNFDPVAANNTVVFNNSAVGTVTAATATQLTVALSTRPASAGPLTAIVTNEGGSSGSAVQVATVIPVITSSTANLAIGATTLTINGFGFSSTAGNNTVVFTPAGSGTVTAATTTSLTVTGLGGLSAGTLNAVVTTNTVSSGSAVPVATVVAVPAVTGVSPARGPTTGATRVTLTGTNLTGATSVTIGGTAATAVTVVDATSITCTAPAGVAGTASVVVSTPGGSNAANTLYTYLAAPAVTSRTVNLAANAATVTIAGANFDPVVANNTVVFNNSAVGTVTAASATQLTVTFSTKPASAGPLTAIVTNEGGSSGSAVPVATVIPVITSSTANLAISASTVTIDGFGFSPTAGNNTVVFTPAGSGIVTAATATTLTVTGLSGLSAGTLNAVVTTNTVSSGTPVAVATILVRPVISQQPTADSLIVTGATLPLSVTATGSALTYQWYQGTSGSILNPVSGATSSSFTIPPLTTTTSYWVRVSNLAGHADSSVANVVLNTRLTVLPATGGTVTGAGLFAQGLTANLNATPEPGYVFTGWTGDISGTTNPRPVLMNADKTIGAAFEPDPIDADGDGLSAYLEKVVYGTNPNLADTDADGLTDAWEVGLGRFSIIPGNYTWAQARTHAKAQGGDLASFADENRWNRAMETLGANALGGYNGLWIGASDAKTEGTWVWVNGQALGFQRWAATAPGTLAGDLLDYAEVAGGAGAEIGKWYDRAGSTVRDGYVLEMGYATSPTDSDSDDDGLSDGQERTLGTDSLRPDTDGDGLGDAFEIKFKFDPRNQDSDGDGILDGAEDEDLDTLTNSEEAAVGTSPRAADSDKDGLLDGEEVKVNLTDPNKYDTDGDFLSDGAEAKSTATNPMVKDTNGNGVADADEDFDGDGFTNRQELEVFLTAPNNPLDRFEIEFEHARLAHSLTFQTVSGRRYRVESSLRIDDPSGWVEVLTFVGNGATANVPLGPPISSRWFYRVRVSLN